MLCSLVGDGEPLPDNASRRTTEKSAAEKAAVHTATPTVAYFDTLGRAFLTERDHDCWEGLLLSPGDKSAIYLGKLAGNLLLMLLVEAIMLVLFGVFFNLDVGRHLPALAGVVVLGTVGFAAVGTLFAAMTAQVRARELLFPVLLLPVLVPVLLGSVKATEAVLAGEGLGGVTHWLKLLAAADAVYVAVGVLTFDAILEG